MSRSSGSSPTRAWSWFVGRGGAVGLCVGIGLGIAWYAYLLLTEEPGAGYGGLWVLVPTPLVGATVGAVTGALLGAARAARQRG